MKQWKIPFTIIAVAAIALFGYVFVTPAIADIDADNSYSVKFFNCQSVSGGMDKFTAQVNEWLADPNNRVRDASIMFSYNFPDSALVSVFYKRGPVENPYQVKFFTSNSQSKNALRRLSDGKELDAGLTDDSGMNDFMANKNIECRYFSQNTVGEKVLMAVVYQARED